MEGLLEKLFNDHPNTMIMVGVAIVVITGLWQYWRHTSEWNFRNYHQLIKDLSEPESPSQGMKLDRHIAIAFELRNYPRYFPVSRRILEQWIKEGRDERRKEKATWRGDATEY